MKLAMSALHETWPCNGDQWVVWPATRIL